MTHDAITLVRGTHREAKTLCEDYLRTEDPAVRRKTLRAIARVLVVHTVVNEEILYPRVLEAMRQNRQDVVYDVVDHHRRVRTLVQQFDDEAAAERGAAGPLVEDALRLLRVEETELLPDAELLIDPLEREALGEQMAARGAELRAATE